MIGRGMGFMPLTNIALTNRLVAEFNDADSRFAPGGKFGFIGHADFLERNLSGLLRRNKASKG
jgi:hypothetical protein